MDILINAGYEVRFVGGCVRDCLAGQTVGDIDLATTATPEQVVEVFDTANIRCVPTGIDHGTVTVIVEEKTFEITTLRRDIKTDGRHAEVVFSTDWREDAARRDFTINALSVDQDGTLYDYFDGVQDLNAGIVRFIGDPDQRIQEDYLRILRFFRFSARFSKQGVYDQSGLEACVRHKEELKKLSVERLQSEFFKMIDQVNDGSIFEEISELNIFEINNLSCVFNLKYQCKKTAFFYFGFVKNGQSVTVVQKQWKLSNAMARTMKLFVKADQLLQNGYTQYQAAYYTDQKVVHDLFIARGQDVGNILGWQKPSCPITAQTLMDQGYTPGPELGQKLKDLEREWVENDLT